MKKLAIIIGAFVILLGAGAAFMLSRDDADHVSNASVAQTPEAQKKQDFASVSKDVESGALLVDVRTPEEYAQGHFANAKNHSLQQLETGALPSTDKNAKLYVYCRSGNRSAQATTILKSAGFSNVTDLGGLDDVQAIGGTIGQ